MKHGLNAIMLCMIWKLPRS